MNTNSILNRMTTVVWSIFKNGLITVAPLLLTIAVFNILFKIIKGLLEPIRNLVIEQRRTYTILAGVDTTCRSYHCHYRDLIAWHATQYICFTLYSFVGRSMACKNPSYSPYIFGHETTSQIIWSSRNWHHTTGSACTAFTEHNNRWFCNWPSANTFGSPPRYCIRKRLCSYNS